MKAKKTGTMIQKNRDNAHAGGQVRRMKTAPLKVSMLAYICWYYLFTHFCIFGYQNI
jgi:hypothetical protein